MADDKHPLSEFPFYEIHDWNEHQHPNADCGKYFAVKSEILRVLKVQTLTNAEFGLLVRLWAYRSTGLNPPRAPSRLVVSIGQTRTKHLVRQLKTLEQRGFLIPSKIERPRKRRGIGEDRIGEKKERENPTATGQLVGDKPTGSPDSPSPNEIEPPEPEPTTGPKRMVGDKDQDAMRAEAVRFLRAVQSQSKP